MSTDTKKEMSAFEKKLSAFASLIDAEANKLVLWDNQSPPQVRQVNFEHPHIKTMVDSIKLNTKEESTTAIAQLVSDTATALNTCIKSVLSGVQSESLISALQDIVNEAANEPDKLYLFLQVNTACVSHVERVCTKIAEWCASQEMSKLKTEILGLINQANTQTPKKPASADPMFN